MNTGVTKSDFIYFQNEILKDLKNLELKFNEKTEEMFKSINTNKTSIDSDITKLYKLFVDISEKVGLSEDNSKFATQLNTVQKKLEELTLNSRIKTNSIEKEINNMTIKYDKIFINNLIVPGLIGNSCPFPSLAIFIENINKKINELIVDKKKQGIDLKSYKDKLENLIGQFNTRINGVEEKFKEYCNICFSNFDKNSNDRFNSLEEKIGTLRMENVKHSSELIERSNELKMDWDKIQNIETVIYKRLDSELEKYAKYNNDLLRTFDSQKSEFTLLKKRFTELSDFIKDVRFRNNLTSLNNNDLNSNITANNNAKPFSQLSNFQKKVKFNEMSKRINFKLKQKLDDAPKKNKSNKELNKFADIEEKKDNSIAYSPAKTEFHFKDSASESILSDSREEKNEMVNNVDKKDIDEDINKSQDKDDNKEKEKYIINKPMELEKVGSTLKNYFNSNKSYRGSISNSNKNLTIHTIVNKQEKGQNSPLIKDKAQHQKRKNKTMIKKDNENEFSGEEEKIKSIINKNIEIKSAKKEEKEKQEKSNTPSDLEEDLFSTKKISKLKESPKQKKSKQNKFNKNIKISSVKKKDKENYKINTFENTPKIIDNKNNKNLLTLNYIKGKEIQKENNNRTFKPLTKNNSPIKIDTINSDKTDFSNNFIDNENKKKNMPKTTFSFITNTNEVKESFQNLNFDVNTIDGNNNPINYYPNINIGEESMNLDFILLNKKIIKTNNRLTELYTDSDKKITKVYQYVKKVFDHLSGIFYFKDLYKQKFSFDFSPKDLMTQSDFASDLTVKRNNKTKILLKKKNYFSPLNLKKEETYKTLVNRIEPYLIQKFKE